MITHNINPTILHLGPLEIRWYGVMYLLAFLIVHYYCKRAIKQGKLKITEKELDDLLGQQVLAMIIGARIFYALFYNPTYFMQYPWKIIAVWEGGLSFHGGLIAMIITGVWFCRKKKLHFWQLVDVFIVPLSLGNALGRIGNFINGELYGIPTSLPWGILFPGTTEPRHPTQLYEAAYNVLIFGILYATRNKPWKPGTHFGLFLILYGIFRFATEFIKDLPVYGPLTMGQWLTLPVFLAGIWLVWRNKE
ncbi:prolipoprotein diacylglyceryl transferase [Candidatus Woesearchaeota archaeon]|nr:prolipoprotein diacylglyceryl transferase [Candidatus Woesearchaeota archaeon]